MTNQDPTVSGTPQPADPTFSQNPSLPDSTLPDSTLPGADRRDSVKQALTEVKHTRTKSAWVGIIVGAIVLIALLVFILQNLANQRIHLFFWTVSLPQGISLLIAAIAGALITAVVGGARIFQIRRAVKKA